MIGMVTLVSKVNELVSGSVLIMLNLLVLYSKKYLLFYQSFYIHEIKKIWNEYKKWSYKWI
jgi:hypothetical protein